MVYYMTKNEDEQGYHVVHKEGCKHLPGEYQRLKFGDLPEGLPKAIKKGLGFYTYVKACPECCADEMEETKE